ncbi:MAG: nucleotidyltransferase domain-containing protein [Desulfovibrio sp.]|jgi:predicted nucleotidyltransferase|nr:nucleotidyltransferase domain-containing protein [Desulfovibrio sp.]
MKQPSGHSFLIEQAQTLCREHGASLLFLTLFGSTLYGTETPGKSDVDVRGIFLPSPESLALNKAPKSLHFSTGNNERRNLAGDVDIDLWSAQHWLLKLLPSGDTGALDVLFAPSHASRTLYRHPALDEVFANPLRLMDTGKGRAYAEYSLGQAKKYGIKGSRVGALRTVRVWLQEHCPEPHSNERLGDYLDALAASCADDRFCSIVAVQEERALQLCGKLHMGTIRMEELARRVEADMRRYGARAEDAERNEGLDFKALSHALRALDQMEELLQTGRIVFPLRNREELIAVKEGRYPWRDVEPRILERLAAVDALRENAPFTGAYDAAFAETCLLACYEGGKTPPAASTCATRFVEGFSVPAATVAAIQAKLDAIEREHNVKVLYAVESGSRGWGFASEDSDFDVRFIYACKPEWYLGVAPEERRDVLELGIEMTPVGELDINGWELRKALKLFRLSNPPLLEWLSSPLVYREAGPLATLLRNAAPSCTSPVRTWHHYRSLMKKSRARYWEKKASVKAWFYLLRPLFAMRWIELGKGVPPMRFDLLMDGVVADATLRQELDALAEAKRRGGEQDGFTPPPLTEAFVCGEWDRLEREIPTLAVERQKADLDDVFKTVLAAAWPQGNVLWKR